MYENYTNSQLLDVYKRLGIPVPVGYNQDYSRAAYESFEEDWWIAQDWKGERTYDALNEWNKSMTLKHGLMGYTEISNLGNPVIGSPDFLSGGAPAPIYTPQPVITPPIPYSPIPATPVGIGSLLPAINWEGINPFDNKQWKPFGDFWHGINPADNTPWTPFGDFQLGNLMPLLLLVGSGYLSSRGNNNWALLALILSGVLSMTSQTSPSRNLGGITV